MSLKIEPKRLLVEIFEYRYNGNIVYNKIGHITDVALFWGLSEMGDTST